MQISLRVLPESLIMPDIFMPKHLHYVKASRNKEFYSGGVCCGEIICEHKHMKFRLAEFRKRHELTQQQVADRIGISVGLYNQLESGKRRMNETYIQSLAALYRISPVQLIVDETRNDPLFAELDEAYRLLSPAERQILVSSAKGIAAAKVRTE